MMATRALDARGLEVGVSRQTQRPGATRLLVTDLDNTLWDWFEAWHGSFSAMLFELVQATGIPQEVLEDEIRTVHRKYHTTEYSNLLNELPSLQKVATTQEPWRSFPRALEALRSERRRLTKLYPGVLETLTTLRSSGYRIAAYTESLAYWTEWRIRRTGLDGIIDVLYSAPDHHMPDGVSATDLRSRPSTYYGLRATEHRHVERGVLKPNVGVLEGIVRDLHTEKSNTVYIGDSLMKDIAMAQAAGVPDVHAKYGEVQHHPGYELLRRVTHWTEEDVERERLLAKQREIVVPTSVCQDRFDEILSHLPLP
ncbi:HAD family hydrolase [Aestuariimicrobium sp. Y1814]|uniref:HAD family hydrolase n=1 Tax=Aestuariimicrobium sp. Y1814 TaxID=3418742 RepID=UPI003DA76852